MNADPPAGPVLHHSFGRTIAFLAIILVWVAFQGHRLALDPPGWVNALGGVIVVLLGYVGVMVAVQSVRGVPVLQVSDEGLVACNPWGKVFVRWSDIAGFEPGRFRWLRIRLRDGAQPVGTEWTRILSTSLWAENTVAVQMYTTKPSPQDVANALTEMRDRGLAGGVRG